MKLLLAAAALAAIAVPAVAAPQVAAGSVPNTFDRPGQQVRAQTAAPARPAPSQAPAPSATTPANARSEAVLRGIIAGAQSGRMDYSIMTADLAAQVREQEATVTPMIQGYGAIQAVDFVTQRDGVDLFKVTFANAATEWIIGIDDAGKVAALLFRPAP